MAVLTARTRRVGRVAVATSVVAAALAVPVSGQTLTQDEALALAFGSADVERRTAFLDEGQLETARRLAGPGVEIEQAVLPYYVATADGAPVGVAYFDAHRVRTLQEVLMVVVDPGGGIQRVETVSFREPPEYRAPDGWVDQFLNRELDDDLSLRGDIAPMTGATLTANAVTSAVRRVLALHRVIAPFASSEGSGPSRERGGAAGSGDRGDSPGREDRSPS